MSDAEFSSGSNLSVEEDSSIEESDTSTEEAVVEAEFLAEDSDDSDEEKEKEEQVTLFHHQQIRTPLKLSANRQTLVAAIVAANLKNPPGTSNGAPKPSLAGPSRKPAPPPPQKKAKNQLDPPPPSSSSPLLQAPSSPPPSEPSTAAEGLAKSPKQRTRARETDSVLPQVRLTPTSPSRMAVSPSRPLPSSRTSNDPSALEQGPSLSPRQGQNNASTEKETTSSPPLSPSKSTPPSSSSTSAQGSSGNSKTSSSSSTGKRPSSHRSKSKSKITTSNVSSPTNPPQLTTTPATPPSSSTSLPSQDAAKKPRKNTMSTSPSAAVLSNIPGQPGRAPTPELVRKRSSSALDCSKLGNRRSSDPSMRPIDDLKDHPPVSVSATSSQLFQVINNPSSDSSSSSPSSSSSNPSNPPSASSSGPSSSSSSPSASSSPSPLTAEAEEPIKKSLFRVKLADGSYKTLPVTSMTQAGELCSFLINKLKKEKVGINWDLFWLYESNSNTFVAAETLIWKYVEGNKELTLRTPTQEEVDREKELQRIEELNRLIQQRKDNPADGSGSGGPNDPNNKKKKNTKSKKNLAGSISSIQEGLSNKKHRPSIENALDLIGLSSGSVLDTASSLDTNYDVGMQRVIHKTIVNKEPPMALNNPSGNLRYLHRKIVDLETELTGLQKKLASRKAKPSKASLAISLEDLRIKQKIADVGGSSAAVYSVVVDGWVCAMKELNLDEVPSSEQFQTEIIILASLPHHPNIVKYLFHSESPKKLRLFITLYDGALGPILRKRHEDKLGPFPPSILKRLLYDIASGLHFLHSHNIIHRDLKSDNIFVMNGGDPENMSLVIADFDTAHEVESPDQLLNMTIGTPGWMPAEVLEARDQGYNLQADIFSFGMIVFELLAQTSPYRECANSIGVTRKVLEGKRPKLPELHPNYMPFIDLFNACTSHNPNDRPDSYELISTIELLKATDINEFSAADISLLPPHMQHPLVAPDAVPTFRDPDPPLLSPSSSSPSSSSLAPPVSLSSGDPSSSSSSSSAPVPVVSPQRMGVSPRPGLSRAPTDDAESILSQLEEMLEGFSPGED